ncbi:Sxm1 protein [Maudiozyma humilis]|uniref:Sxm1 protein n=1 Tax=Maudiozyma humilis TaxID=51915 RepID=A0AAV5SA71_MAUHU|nr:Sxm1 protein [Kazachstania humilis]
MLDEQAILSCIEQTMVADAKVIKDAEMKLFEFQKESGFTALILKAVANEAIPLNIRMSSAIYFKNKVQRSWVNYETNSTHVEADDITPDEQQLIRENLIQIIVENVDNNHIRPHLTEALSTILMRYKTWDLTSVVKDLLESGKQEYTYSGLLILFEICKVHRYDMCDNRVMIDTLIANIFPIIENMLSGLVNETDYKSSEFLYLILKFFKYACLNNYPQYFNDPSKLDSWIQLHLFICSKPLPKEVMELDPADRSLDKRVKVQKWGYGNLNRFVHRFSKTTKHVSEQFVANSFTNIIPKILQEYFSVMGSWSQKSLWLSDASLYHLIQFLEKCMTTDELYPLIEPHVDAIIKNLIFRCLCANEEVAELFEVDPEDYTRRYFDMNKEGSTADVASTDFIFLVGHKRSEQLATVIPFVSEVFNQFVQNPNNISVAYEQEGAMRTISSLFSFFETQKDTGLEGIFTHYIVNLLSQTTYPFLVARALETVANYQAEFTDMDTLSKIYELTYNHLLNTDILPIQIEAADALKTLIIANPSIHSHITPQVPGIMEKLLKLSKEFEIDMISEVMESFVERFADVLTPFAKDLARNLAEQYLKLGQSMIEGGNEGYSTGDQDQEMQASSLLQTMTTMVMSMNKVSLAAEYLPVCKFIVHNAQIILLTEAVDLMDALALSSRTMTGQLSPEVWEMFGDVLDSFQMYAMDYFESYGVFFETVVLYGFPQNQTYVPVFMQILEAKLLSEIDYDIENVLNLLTMYSLSMHDIPLLAQSLKAADNDDVGVEGKQIVKLFLADLLSKPIETLQVCEAEGQSLKIMTKWFDSKFSSVFAVKLQIMAILCLLGQNELPGTFVGFLPQLSTKLVSLMEQLPKALRNRDAVSKGEDITGVLGSGDDDEEDDDYFDDVDDDFKETSLDNLNAFEEVHTFLNTLQSQNPAKYQQFAAALDDEKKHALQIILEFVAQSK